MKILSIKKETQQKIFKEINMSSDKDYSSEDFRTQFGNIIEWLFGGFLNIVRDVTGGDDVLGNTAALHNYSQNIMKNGYDRSDLSSFLVGKFIRNVKIEKAKDISLTKVYLTPEIKLAVEILKKISYISLINSPRLKISEFRGKVILKEIFNSLYEDKLGYKLLPYDYQKMYLELSDKDEKRRIICDFIAGMTDRYALEFYGRLKSEKPETIFKPL
ncbi:MAG: hypothetical protein PF693_09215 [Spirochaetia bacterium]|nr:hypothetical protein [Spirochaetia bacterium]